MNAPRAPKKPAIVSLSEILGRSLKNASASLTNSQNGYSQVMQYQFSPLNSQPDTAHESMPNVSETQRPVETHPKSDILHSKVEGIQFWSCLQRENSAQIQKLTKTVEALLSHLSNLREEICTTNGKLESSVQLQKQVSEKVNNVVGDYGDANTQLTHTLTQAVREDWKIFENRLQSTVGLMFLEQKKEIHSSLQNNVIEIENFLQEMPFSLSLQSKTPTQPQQLKQRKKKTTEPKSNALESQTHELQLELEGFPFWQERATQSSYGLRKSVSMKIPYSQAEEPKSQKKPKQKKSKSNTKTSELPENKPVQQVPEQTTSLTTAKLKPNPPDFSFEEAFLVDVAFNHAITTVERCAPEEADELLSDFAMSPDLLKTWQ